MRFRQEPVSDLQVEPGLGKFGRVWPADSYSEQAHRVGVCAVALQEQILKIFEFDARKGSFDGRLSKVTIFYLHKELIASPWDKGRFFLGLQSAAKFLEYFLKLPQAGFRSL